MGHDFTSISPLTSHKKKAGLKAALLCCGGCLLFFIVDNIRGIYLYDNYISNQFLLPSFLLGSLISCPPAFLGGQVLLAWIYQDKIQNKLTPKTSMIKGTVIGGGIGFGICVSVWGFLLLISSHDPDPGLFAFRTLVVIIIALFIGGFMGQNFYSLLKR